LIRARWVAAACLAIVTVLIAPGFSTGFAAGASIPLRPMVAIAPSPGPLPLALSAPWADRAGFISSVHPDDGSTVPAGGEVSVSITLWPSSLSLFDSPSLNAAPLTPAEFDQRYSPSAAEYQSFVQYFEGFGLTILHTWPDRLSLTVQGPAARIGEAFGTSLLRGTVAGLPVQYPQAVPTLPPALESDVSAITGLSSGFAQFSLPLVPVSPALLSENHLTTDLGSTTTEVTPSGAHGAYGFDALYNSSGTFHSASSQNIVLLLWGEGYDPSDISTFFSTYYPSEYPVKPTVTAYPIDGAPAPSANAVNDPSGGPQELTLDLEWSGSMAPGANLDAVYAPDGPAPSYSPNDTPMEDALHYAVVSIPGVSVISMSFGLPETEDPSFQAAYTTLFAEAESRGITVLGASGDDGGSQMSHGACTPTAEVEFPASSPDVIGVGGTEPTLNVSLSDQITGIATQPAWNRSGGGLSQEYSAPSWQVVGSAANVIKTGGRGVPDVAGPAADNMVYYNGQVEQLGGTSFATPFWGGLIAEYDAIRGTSFGFVTPRLYALAAEEEAAGGIRAFSDITAGANCFNSAQPGWDLVTGWGTPRPLLLYAALTSTFVSLGLSPSPGTVFPGGSTQVTVTVKNATNGNPISGVSVSLILQASAGYTGPCGGVFGNTTAVTNSNGTAVSKFTVPYCYFGGQAQLSATLLSGGLFGEASASVAVSLLSGSGFIELLGTFPYNVLFFTLIILIALLIGAVLSRRSRRRRARVASAYPPEGVSGPSPAAPSWAPAPSAPPPSPRGPPGTSPMYAPGGPYGSYPGGMGTEPPAPAMTGSPAPAAPPAIRSAPVSSPSPPPIPQAVRCPSCGTVIPAFSLSCPKCGLARP
jgi:kumamolisin